MITIRRKVDHYLSNSFSVMALMDHKIKEDMGQYMHSLNAVSDPKVPKKDINVDPLIHQIY